VLSAGFNYNTANNCRTADQIAAEWVRASIQGLGRWRPGLDFVLISNPSSGIQYAWLTPNGKWPYNIPVQQYSDGGNATPPTPGTEQIFTDINGKQYQLPADLDGDHWSDGQAYCDKTGKCGELQLLLSLQAMDVRTAWSLENSKYMVPFVNGVLQTSGTPNPNYDPTLPEFPWFWQFQAGDLYGDIQGKLPTFNTQYPPSTTPNACANGSGLNCNQVMAHSMTFDHISNVKNQHTATCNGGDYRYHCYNVGGITQAQIPTLISQIQGTFATQAFSAMINITTEPSQKYSGQTTICFDPDGGGGDGSTGAGSGSGATCSDGSMPITYTDNDLGACCSVLTPGADGGSTTTNGIWMRHPTVKTNLICRLSDIALNVPTAYADSTASGGSYSAANVPKWYGPGSGWVAADNNTGHYWQVDLGSVQSIHAMMLQLPNAGLAYTYSITASPDNVNWSSYPVRGQNTPNLQFQDTNIVASTRYVRVQFTGLPSGYPAGLMSAWIY
jgi:hypothetical protein